MNLKTIRELLYERTRGYCDCCGLPMTLDDMAAHHRRLRKHGGLWKASNLLGCHHSCHTGSGGSVHLNVAMALQLHWLVHSWQKPEQTPFLLHQAHWVQPHDDWTLEYLSERYEGDVDAPALG